MTKKVFCWATSKMDWLPSGLSLRLLAIKNWIKLRTKKIKINANSQNRSIESILKSSHCFSNFHEPKA
jgi:hypothetical protein